MDFFFPPPPHLATPLYIFDGPVELSLMTISTISQTMLPIDRYIDRYIEYIIDRPIDKKIDK